MNGNNAQVKFIFVSYRIRRKNVMQKRQNQTLVENQSKIQNRLILRKLIQLKCTNKNLANIGMIGTEADRHVLNCQKRESFQLLNTIRQHKIANALGYIFDVKAYRNDISNRLFNRFGLQLCTSEPVNKSIKITERLIPIILFVQRKIDRQTNWLEQMYSRTVGRDLDVFRRETRTMIKPTMISLY